MELRSKRQRRPVSRPRLGVCLLVVVPCFFIATTGLATFWLVTFMRGQTRLVRLDERPDGEATDITAALPGLPRRIAGAGDGSLWVETRMWGSLSRYHDGHWQVFRDDTFGTRANTPTHGFVVVGSHVWAVFDQKLAHFDGRHWHTCDIPDPAQDHVLAANPKATWVLGNDGILRKWAQGAWQLVPTRAGPAETRWDPEQAFRAPRLVACEDGSLWLCAQRVWRLDQDQWKPVDPPGLPAELELLGYADGRVWFNAPGALVWVSEDAEKQGRFAFETLGLDGNSSVCGVCAMGEQVVASSNRGVHVLQHGKWELRWPAGEGVLRYEALAVTDGHVFAKAITLKSIPALWYPVPVVLLLSGLATLGIIRFLKPDYSLRSCLGRQHLVALVLVLGPFLATAAAGVNPAVWGFVVPFAICGASLLVPPFVLLLIWMRERVDGSLEIVRFESVSAGELPPAVRGWFEQHTPDVEALGFRLIGDFRLKQRAEHFGRFFQSGDGTVFGEIAWYRGSFLQTHKCVDFFSVTDDLTYLETGNVSIPPGQYEAPFLLCGVPKATAEETLAAHRRQLDRLKEDAQAEPIRFAPDEVDKVTVYGQKLLYERLKQIGMVRRSPYDDVEVEFDGVQRPGAATLARESDAMQPPAPIPRLADTIDDGGFPRPVG